MVGCGIAMKNHAAVLDTVAKRIAGGVDEDGIYYELKDFPAAKMTMPIIM